MTRPQNIKNSKTSNRNKITTTTEKVNDTVVIQPNIPEQKQWWLGQIITKLDQIKFNVETENGHIIVRIRFNLRK